MRRRSSPHILTCAGRNVRREIPDTRMQREAAAITIQWQWRQYSMQRELHEIQMQQVQMPSAARPPTTPQKGWASTPRRSPLLPVTEVIYDSPRLIDFSLLEDDDLE